MKFSGLGGRLYRGETSIEIIGARKKWYALSGVFVILSMFALGVQGLQLGIEFKGGAAFTVTTTSGTIEEARTVVTSTGYSGNTIVQTIGSDKIRVQTGVLESAQSNAIQDALAAKFGVSIESIDVQNVGPSWGEEISRKAFQGLIAFLICIMIYLALAFEPKIDRKSVV